MHRDIAVLIIVILLSGFAHADEHQPEGENCAIPIPPDNSGEEINHGVTLKIYPRAKDIGGTYSGCQSLWAPDKNGWVVVAVSEYIDGYPVRLWSPHVKDPERKACRYSEGKLVSGNRDKCPIPESLVIRSLPTGCVEKIRKAVVKNGLGGQRPPENKYE